MEMILLARISQIVLVVFSGSSFEVFIGVKILTVVLVFKVLVWRFLKSVSKTSTFENQTSSLTYFSNTTELNSAAKLNYCYVKRISFNSHVICLVYDKPVSGGCAILCSR